MEEALVLIQQYQSWLYVLFGLLALLYARQALGGYGELRRALFGLEREQASARLKRSLAFLSLAMAAASAVFILTTFVTPALPIGGAAAPIPTISLLTTPSPLAQALGTASGPAVSVPPSTVDSSGCANPEATITEPQPNATLSGLVLVRGTAAITNFGFFKLEYRGLTDQGAWLAILASETPVTSGDLGTWDTSLVLPGDYALRLVVADTAGNAPMPCVIPVRIVPPA